MHNIINKIVKQRGIDILYSKTLISCMDDEGAFDDIEMRSYKKILRTIVGENYTHKLVEIGAWNAEAETLARTFAQRNKLQEDEIIYVFSCLAYGLGWLKITPQIPAEVKKKRQQEAQKKAKEVEAAQKRNEEVIRKNAEEAARKKAEIAEKRALEAERQAAEAERKAKEAEKIAKERADKQAANLVISMIKNIGVIESTKECRDKVSAALLAYKMLNSSQQVLVDLQVGDALQRMADETKKIAEDTARKKVEEARKKAEELSKKRKKHIVTIVWVICCIIGFCILVKMCSSDSLSEDETEYIIEADNLQEDIIDLQLDDSKDLLASNTSSPESEKNDWKSKYDYVYPLSDGVYKVEKRNKKGFCDKNGKVLLPCEYDYIYNKDDGLYKVEKGSKKGFVDAKTYKVLLPCEFDYIYSKADGVYKVEKGDKKGFVDAKTYKVLAPCEYDYIYSASNGLIKVEKGDKKGFLNAQTYKLVTPCIYDYIYSPSGGLIKVEIGSKTGYLNMDGSVAKQPV